MFSSSSDALELGRDLRKAILADNLSEASARIMLLVLNLIAGIADETLRARLRRQVGDRLLTDLSSHDAG